MKRNPDLFTKTEQEIKEHFTLRLKERYDLELTDKEYDLLYPPRGIYFSDQFTAKPIVWAKPRSCKTIFIIEIKHTKVLAVYSVTRKRFITALPMESMHDYDKLMPRKFRKLGLKEEAIKLLLSTIEEIKLVPRTFDKSKEWRTYKDRPYMFSLIQNYWRNGYVRPSALFNHIERKLAPDVDVEYDSDLYHNLPRRQKRRVKAKHQSKINAEYKAMIASQNLTV